MDTMPSKRPKPSLWLVLLCSINLATHSAIAGTRDPQAAPTVLALDDSSKPDEFQDELRALIGDRVRLTGSGVPGGSIVGMLAMRSADTLYVAKDGKPVAVPLTPTPSMHLSLGIGPPNRTPARIMAALGAIGGGYGAHVALAYSDVDHGLVIAAGALVGGALGYLLGALSSPPAEERWQEVPAR